MGWEIFQYNQIACRWVMAWSDMFSQSAAEPRRVDLKQEPKSLVVTSAATKGQVMER